MNRESNFELLRVIAMLFIVAGHFLAHGILRVVYHPDTQLIISSSTGIINFLGTKFLAYLCAVGVNCFVLISSYFSVKPDFRFSRIAKIWIQTVFYSVFICLFFYWGSRSTAVGLPDILKSFFPVQNNIYWFVSNYIAFMLLVPFLSRLTGLLTKRDFQIGIAILSLLNLNIFKNFPYGHIFSGSQSLFWFIYLFFIAAYIRLYEPFKNGRNWGKYYIALCVLLTLTSAVKIYIRYSFFHQVPGYTLLAKYNGMTFFSSLLLFMWAKTRHTADNTFTRFIVKISPYTFGVYLIHDNPYIQRLLWQHWITGNDYLDSLLLIPLILGTTLAIFASCTVIDYFRSKLFNVLHINELTAAIPAQIYHYSQQWRSKVIRRKNTPSDN